MTLFKTSILSFISTSIKVIAALVINKAVAVYIGPAGLALIGQFQNFMQLAMTVAQGALNSGITKYSAEYGRDDERIPFLLSTAGKISIVCSVVVGFCIILFSNYASTYFLKADEFAYVFVLFGFTIVLFVLNNLLLSIINGLKEVRTWVVINILQSVYALIFTSLLIVWLGLDGALIGLVTNQSIIFIVVLWMLRKHPIIKLDNFTQPFDKPEAKKLMGFAIMGLTSAIVVPISHIFVRNYIGENIGWDEAGYWQAIWYISLMYLMVITTTLSVYFLPKLSEITDKKELRQELKGGYKLLIPVAIISALFIFMAQDLVIWLLFTSDFTPMKELFLWQLIGDVIKIMAWLLAFIMLAKAMTKSFVWLEIVFSISFVLLTMFLVNQYGLVGVTYAFALNYMAYFFVTFLVVKKELF